MWCWHRLADSDRFGLGAAVGQRVRMLFSVFVGEPEVDLESYEALGADAT